MSNTKLLKDMTYEERRTLCMNIGKMIEAMAPEDAIFTLTLDAHGVDEVDAILTSNIDKKFLALLCHVRIKQFSDILAGIN